MSNDVVATSTSNAANTGAPVFLPPTSPTPTLNDADIIRRLDQMHLFDGLAPEQKAQDCKFISQIRETLNIYPGINISMLHSMMGPSSTSWRPIFEKLLICRVVVRIVVVSGDKTRDKFFNAEDGELYAYLITNHHQLRAITPYIK